ncbi:PilZ domain-containing protein [Arhodomonas sp. SL1]|uniref:PilZ domain-containing protein n=1 Tax=Arhodomonas sp. SL1 TaxID=3425691 RepID=UPI003F882DE0
MRDARRHQRTVVDRFLPVHDGRTDELIGYLTDINIDGGMIETSMPLDVDGIYHLRIDLNDEPVEGARQVEFNARCIWVRKEKNAVFHHVGLELVDVPPHTRRLLQAIAEHYHLAA